MTPAEFISKWQANTRTERAACQEHFLDLCDLLDEPKPNSDPTGEDYAFEKGVTRFTGQDGWADVWRRGRFAWEYKKRRGDLDAAHRQLLLYAGPLGNPPLLIVSDIARIIIRTNWTNAVTETHEIALEELANPLRLRFLKFAFSDPEQLRPTRTRQALTEEAAAEFAELARRLRDRGHDPQVVAHFVNRLVFCMFANRVGLLPDGLFEQMLAVSKRRPARSAEFAGQLFGAMAKSGGTVGFTAVPWFDGGLFEDATALTLDEKDVNLLISVSNLDWGEIDPSILGTLFERGLDPDKRSQLGAHYTDRNQIKLLIDPVIRQPLITEWQLMRRKIEVALVSSTQRGRRVGGGNETAQALYHGFLERLRQFRVLDPACGSGNFLYLGLQELKDIEHQVGVEAELLGLQREFPQIGPETMLGIEINPYAAELARVSVWIGHIQWNRRHGFAAPSNPVLQPLDTITCCNSILDVNGEIPEWPRAEVIVGNPPILGTKKQLSVLGAEYVDALRAAYEAFIPASSDLCCYWFEKARQQIDAGRASRVGLVATSNIRGGYSRPVLDRILRSYDIYEAWSNQLWPLEGADIRVSLICFGNKGDRGYQLDGKSVDRINVDLTSSAADVTTARQLSESKGIALSGTVKGGKFDVSGELARRWLLEPRNANGRFNSDVLMPWVNASDVTSSRRDMWIIDFGNNRTQQEAAFYVSPYSFVVNHVKPTKERSKKYGTKWWLLSEYCPGLRRAISPLKRYIATPTGSSHRIFVWLDSRIQPDHQLVAIARDDDTSFGILHSRFHEAWTRRLSTSVGVGDDPRYNPETVFETYPFPIGMRPDILAATFANTPYAQAIATAARDLVEKRDLWLNPPDLIERVPEVVPGYPDRIIPRNGKAAAILKTRTLTNLYNTRGMPEGTWLDNLHRALDDAVAAAYGWPSDLSDDEILSHLLDLNRARSAMPPG
jgi:type II restriction/modification system DNA methylase subunit YeeA